MSQALYSLGVSETPARVHLTRRVSHHSVGQQSPAALAEHVEHEIERYYRHRTALATYRDDHFWAVLPTRACGRVINYNSRPRGSKRLGRQAGKMKGHKPTQRDALPFSSPHGVFQASPTACVEMEDGLFRGQLASHCLGPGH